MDEDAKKHYDRPAHDSKAIRAMSQDSASSNILNSKQFNQGRILHREEDEDVVVSPGSYWQLFKPAGGIIPVIFINVSMILFMGTTIGTSFYIQKWAYSSPED